MLLLLLLLLLFDVVVLTSNNIQSEYPSTWKVESSSWTYKSYSHMKLTGTCIHQCNEVVPGCTFLQTQQRTDKHHDCKLYYTSPYGTVATSQTQTMFAKKVSL